MHIQPIKTRVFRERENLPDFIEAHIPSLKNESVLIVTSKIVALAEGRVVDEVNEKTKETLIKQESEFALKTKWVWLTLTGGIVTATAGIDESNADGKLILLPKDSFLSASRIRRELMKRYKLTKLGVIITDSRTIPMRAGVVALALGYAGIRGIKDYRGEKDIFGRSFRFERVAVADSLATASALAMGEGAEQQPLAVVTDAPVAFTERVNRTELFIRLEDDMYLPFLKKIPTRLLPSHKAKRM